MNWYIIQQPETQEMNKIRNEYSSNQINKEKMRQPQENGEFKEKSLADMNLKNGQHIRKMRMLQSRKDTNNKRRRQKMRPQSNSLVTIK